MTRAPVKQAMQDSPDIDADKARIVRAFFDATDVLSRTSDPRRAADAHRSLDALRAEAQAMDAPGFAEALDTACARLLALLPGDDA